MSAYEIHLIDSGYYDITPEQEREIEAQEKCPTCGGKGEVGWFDHAEGAYRNEPCPDCVLALPPPELNRNKL